VFSVSCSQDDDYTKAPASFQGAFANDTRQKVAHFTSSVNSQGKSWIDSHDDQSPNKTFMRVDDSGTAQ
jgi:hypothetical protein